MVKQIGLLPAGCQPWNNDICSATTNNFAYCATLAVYIFKKNQKHNDYNLHSIMSEHSQTITSICWHPQNTNLFASVGVDNLVVVWDVVEQRAISKHVTNKGIPRSVGWCPHENNTVSFTSATGPLYIWKFQHVENSVSPVKDTQGFVSDICQHRWHPKKLGRLIFGHKDGSISIINLGHKSQKHVLAPAIEEGEEVDEKVTALEWDPLSFDYVLVSNHTSGVRLVDVHAISVIMHFELPSAATQVHTLSWISSAPGIFVTGDSHSGVLRLWNVSKTTPLENIKLRKNGFHCLSVVCETEDEKQKNDVKSHLSSTSLAQSKSLGQSNKLPLNNTSVVCTFLDGGVGLYNLSRRKWRFLKEKGHMETIFDCEFKPENPDILATASFDGTVKVWDVTTLTAVDSSPGNQGVIYCVSWAPGDLNCLVASTSKQGVFIWDLNRGKIVQRFKEHGQACVFTVAWNRKDSNRIMSSGADNYCIIRHVDGSVLQKYKHPGPVFGCAWSPHNKDMLATGCADKNVRVYYLATSTDQPLKVFTGHSAKVFRVRWSPLREGILCTGSDDSTIRVWDYTQEACVNVLSGHTGPVRGLMWNSEIPYLLVSGSWDYSIRIWDTRDGACLNTMLDHGADVYGLTSHPSRPFILASSSRDSTLRLWSITSLVQPLQLNIISQQPWDTITGTTEKSLSLGSMPLLTGKMSKEIKLQIERLQGNVQARTLRLFSKFFHPPSGTNNLWELVHVIKGQDHTLLSDNYSKGIMHVSHLTKTKVSEAQQLEMIKMSKFGSGIGAPSKEDRLRAASQIYIKLGNIQRYCELMVELGQWERALAVAPGVSLEYWKSLSIRYAESLIQEDSDEALPFCMACKEEDKLVNFQIQRGQLEDAVLTAQVFCEDNHSVKETVEKQLNSNGVEGSINDTSPLLSKACEELAQSYFSKGSPTLAACCHLAVNDAEAAMRKLIRGNELELAVHVGLVLGSVNSLTHIALQYLARRCENLGKWELAVDLLKMIPDNEALLAQLCARCAASMDEINYLHEKAGFPNMEDCVLRAEKLKDQGDVMGAVMYYMMSTSPEEGLEIGLTKVKAIMCKEGWKADDVIDLLQMMGSIKTERLLQTSCDSLRSELLCLSAYVGMLLAVRRNYISIVTALVNHCRRLLRNVEVPISMEIVTKEYKAWVSNYLGFNREDEKLEKIYLNLLDKAGVERWCLGVGADCVASSNLPSHSDVHKSYFGSHRIQGPSFFLEDGQSAISINDALMWAKVNPFSPLGSGVRINPF